MAGRRDIIGEAVVKLAVDDNGFAAKLQKDVAMVKAATKEMGTAEAVIKINGDNTGYNSTMLKTKASLEAAKRALEARKIEIGVKTNVHQAKKELYELRDLLDDAKYRASINYHPAGSPGGIGGQRLTKEQIADNQRLVVNLEKQVKAQDDLYKSLKRKQEIEAGEARLKRERAAALKSLAENTRRLDELETKAEANRIRSAKTLDSALEGLSKRRQKSIAQDVAAAGGMDAYLEKLKEEKRIREEANKVRQAHGMPLLPDDPRKEKNRFWSILTNSDNMRETFGKLMREPVKLGPFTATVKGLAVGAAALAPILMSVIGTVSAMAGAVGGSLVGAFSLGTAALGGFGQAALGIGLVMRPIVNEFKLASQVTNAYGTAVAKYGKNSEQAKKKQEQMNNVLKSMSPTARAAYLDLAKVQTVFAKMTQDARPALESALRGGMNFFRQASPGFAKNTVQATKIGARGLNLSLDRLNSARNRGDDPLNTMFTNANKALGPLIQGMDYLVEGIIKIGASASRHLEPFFKTMRNAFVFKGLDDKGKLNKQIDGLMKDFYSVGGAISSAGGMLTDFFNAGRGAGRGLFDSLGSTFNRWDKFIKENPDKMKKFFDDAAKGGRVLGNAITFTGLAFVQLARITAPVAEGFAFAADKMLHFAAELMKIPGATKAMKLFGAALAGAFVASKVTAMAGAVKTFLTLCVGAPAKVAKGIAAIRAIGLAAAASQASSALLASSFTAALGPVLAVAAAVATIYGLYKLMVHIKNRGKDVQKNPQQLDPRKSLNTAFLPEAKPLTPKQRRTWERNVKDDRDKTMVGASYRIPGSAPDAIKPGRGAPSQAGLATRVDNVQKQMVNKFGRDFTYKASITLDTKPTEQRMNVLDAALNSKLSKPKILKILGNNKSAKDKINELNGIQVNDKNMSVNVRVNFSSQLSNAQMKKVDPNNELGMWNAEGYMPAASGYTKKTAAGSARRRPMRRAMGKFNEPTFLVGEENRSEYVIATNPAYRAANMGYLASAAHEFGMQVVPAAGGFSPYIWARAYAETPTALTKRDNKARARLKVLNKAIYHYDHKKKPKSGAWHTANEIHDNKLRLKEKKHLDNLLSNSKSVKNRNAILSGSTLFKTLNTQLGSYDSRMSLAEKRGDTAAFLSAQDGESKAITSILVRLKAALKGTKNSATKAQIQADIDSMNEKLFDNQNRSIGGYAGALAEAQIGQLNAQLLSSRNENVINSMFGTTTDALGDLIASGGPRMSGKGGSGLAEGGVNIHINTLTAHDPRHEELIRNSVVGALSTQGGVQASSMAVG
jgi:hypothetical protein